MRYWLILAAVLSGSPANAQLSMTGAGAGGGIGAGAVSTYSGPGDVVSSALGFWSCTRAYNAAYATGGNKACSIRRASDSTLQDINVLLDGTFDIASYNTFVGTDATGSCTIASTTLTCTGLGSTLHVSDPISGAGIGQPCYLTAVGAFSAGAQTATINSASTCGTVGAAVTVTAQVAGFVHIAYDQSGNGKNATAPSNGTQPQLIPSATNSLPAMLFSGGQWLTGSLTISGIPVTLSGVATMNSTSQLYQISTGSSGSQPRYGQNNATTVFIYAGTLLTATSANSAWHAIAAIFNGASSNIVVDGTATAGASGAGAAVTEIDIGSGSAGGTQQMIGFMGEAMAYGSAWNSTQYGNEHTNQAAFYGTP